MIRVRMELLPGGLDLKDNHEILGTILISNDIIGSLDTLGRRGTYDATIFKKRPGKVWKRLKIKEYPRQSYHPWELVRRILNEAAEANGGHL